MKKGKKSGYFHPSVTVDIVAFTIEDGALKVLLIERSHEPFKGKDALPGGFLLSGETTHEAAKRVLRDKVGLEGLFMEQLYTFDALDRDPRGSVLSVSYFALAPHKDMRLQASAHTQNPKFAPVNGLKGLAFDHAEIIRYARERLKGRLEYTNIAFSLLPEKFTFAELQSVYETIFGKGFDRRNFRKKIMRLGLVKATKEKVKNGRQRPALLYRPATSKTQRFKDVF
jgi:8-oxo-dGTP diphosphatase